MTPLPPIEEQIRKRRAALIRQEIDRRQAEELSPRSLKGISTEALIDQLKKDLEQKPTKPTK